MRWSYVIGALVAAALLVGGWVWWSSRAPEPEQIAVEPERVEPKAAAVEPAKMDVDPPVVEPIVQPAPVEPEIVLPPLLASDAFVREQVGEEDSGLMAEWLQEDDLVRRAAVVLYNAARGEYPRRQLSFMQIPGAYEPFKRGDQWFVNADSYRRYDEVVAALTAIEAQHMAGMIELFQPLVLQALGDLGVKASEADTTYREAMRQVASTPLLDGSVELVRPNVLFEYADRNLEALTPLQKQLLRVGPENLRTIQAYAREVYSELSFVR
ncbi:MAG: DUF3014 domain-containing protein [Gammaproteobacteria bacterium]|nr:DUF3014 domain-containing protein [Gammaproteobacteria bacterium]